MGAKIGGMKLALRSVTKSLGVIGKIRTSPRVTRRLDCLARTPTSPITISARWPRRKEEEEAKEEAGNRRKLLILASSQRTRRSTSNQAIPKSRKRLSTEKHLLPRAASTRGMATAWVPLLMSVPHAMALDVAMHAAALRSRGFTVIPEPLVPEALINRAATNVATRLESLHQQVAAVGCDPLEQNYLFNEVCHRQRMRWDLQMDGAFDAAHAELCRTIVSAAVAPILDALMLEEAQGEAQLQEGPRGAIVSRPGASAQRPHADAELEHYESAARSSAHRLFNCFIPLVDLAADGDGTQFWPGSHASSEAAMDTWRRAVDPETREEEASARAAEAPACRAGGLILFDFRIIHGGLASGGRTRPIAYVICSTGGAADDSNFPEGKIRDATADAVDEFPFWDEIEFVQ